MFTGVHSFRVIPCRTVLWLVATLNWSPGWWWRWRNGTCGSRRRRRRWTSAGVQLGPRAKATAQFLHYQLGLSLNRCRNALARMFGLTSSRAALCRAAEVTGDETGWRVGGGRAWLWVATCPKATLYKVTPGRGFDDAKLLFDENYAGVSVCACRRRTWLSSRLSSRARRGPGPQRGHARVGRPVECCLGRLVTGQRGLDLARGRYR